MDQLVLDILWSRLIATVNEQAAALMRSSFTSIVRDAGDLSAAVFDRRGRMVAQAVTGTPGHINSMATGMTHFLQRYPLDQLNDGDVLITNDPWKTASQLNDITVVSPVFHRSRLVAFFASCCHTQDIGGRGLSADSKSVFEEGLIIPIMKLYDAGRPNEILLEMLRTNVRTPEEAVGDLHSQVTGNKVGGRQLVRFLDEFGLEDIEALSDAITDRTEQGMRARIRELPDGLYRYSLQADGIDHPLALTVRIDVQGDRMIVDYDGSSGPSELGINVCLNYTKAYTTYGVKCVLSPDIPNNDGSFRPIEIRAPEGSILNAQPPSAVCGRHLVGHYLPSLVMGALSRVEPDNVMAPGADALWESHIMGIDGRTGKETAFTWFASGGTGALSDQDGMAATAFPSGVANVAAEVIESLAPVRILERSLRTDSGGAGRFRGGLGQVLAFEVRTSGTAHFAGMYDRVHNAAPGLDGGLPGAPGGVTSDANIEIEPKRIVQLRPGTIVRLELPGGGGVGKPHERDPELVRADVENGYVATGAARDLYGVVLHPIDRSVDLAATHSLRKQKAAPAGR
ncbi:hydantoinase B/oxoprolinase family protein [Reyranella sp.]|jgi:N-methylhydantoinase B|uniref:hydantoinase B/oxoprolinase family protein n=1 Tax=Reyranella sp. TaxID=1929291 RepID=UPI003F71F44B